MKEKSAMKFLKASGLAVSAILAVVVAMASFGVQDASGNQPVERCSAYPPLSCSYSRVSEDGVSLILSNYDSRIMEIKKIEIISDALGDCSWEASGNAYPELETGKPIVYTLTSNSSANNGNGTFIPKSARRDYKTRYASDNNANLGDADNSSLAGCAFNPDNSRSRDDYEFTITYNWENSELTHTAQGRFFTKNPRGYDNLDVFLFLFFILYLLSGLWAVRRADHAKSKRRH